MDGGVILEKNVETGSVKTAANKLAHIDLKNHKFEKYMRDLIAWEKAGRAARAAQPPKPKTIEAHIVPKYNDEEHGWGMYNERIEAWAGREEPRQFWRTEQAAIDWYRSIL